MNIIIYKLQVWLSKWKKNEIHKNNTAYIIEKEIDYKFLIL